MSLNKCIIASLVLTVSAVNLTAQDLPKRTTPEGPPMFGIHWARGVMPPARGSGSPDMTFHAGTIMVTTSTQAIFWGTSWTNPGDKISGMDTWYSLHKTG